MPSDNNFEEVTRLVKSLVVKVNKLDSDSQGRHDVLCLKLQQLESKTANLSGEIHDLQQGLDFTNKEVETLKDTLSNKVDCTRIAILEKKDSKTSRTDQKETILSSGTFLKAPRKILPVKTS